MLLPYQVTSVPHLGELRTSWPKGTPPMKNIITGLLLAATLVACGGKDDSADPKPESDRTICIDFHRLAIDLDTDNPPTDEEAVAALEHIKNEARGGASEVAKAAQRLKGNIEEVIALVTAQPNPVILNLSTACFRAEANL